MPREKMPRKSRLIAIREIAMYGTDIPQFVPTQLASHEHRDTGADQGYAFEAFQQGYFDASRGVEITDNPLWLAIYGDYWYSGWMRWNRKKLG